MIGRSDLVREQKLHQAVNFSNQDHISIGNIKKDEFSF